MEAWSPQPITLLYAAYTDNNHFKENFLDKVDKNFLGKFNQNLLSFNERFLFYTFY